MRVSATAMSAAVRPTISAASSGVRAARAISGPRQQRACELGVLGEPAENPGGLGGKLEIGGRARVGALERGARAADGVADRGRAELSGFHGCGARGGRAAAGRGGVSSTVDCRYHTGVVLTRGGSHTLDS